MRKVVIAGLGTAVCAAPLALGSVHPWTVTILCAFLLVLACLQVVARIRKSRQGPTVDLMTAVIAVAAIAAFLQSVPLPPGLVEALSPRSYEIRTGALLKAGLMEDGAWLPLSLDAPASAFECAKLMGVLAAFVLALNLSRSRKRQDVTLLLVVAGAVAAAIVAYVQLGLGVSKLLGFYDAPRTDTAWFRGSFVNENHLAGLMLLGSLTAAGLAAASEERLRTAVLYLSALACGVANFLCESRGGIAAYVLGLVLLGAMLMRSRSEYPRGVSRILMVALPVIGLGLAITAVRLSGDYGRLFDATELASDAKVRAWIDAWPLFKDFFWTGIGRGAYLMAYPLYTQGDKDLLFSHLENEPLQLIADYGVPLGALLLGVILFVMVRYARRVVDDPAFAGALVGLVALGIHNLVDFNLEILGVAIPAAVALGAVAARARRPRRDDDEPAPHLLRTAVLATVGLVAGGVMLAVSLARSVPWLREVEAPLLASGSPFPDDPDQRHATLDRAHRILARHPADAYLALAFARKLSEGRLADIPRALYWVNRALFLAPRDPRPHHAAAVALARLGRRSQAALELRLAAEIRPASRRPLLGAALSLLPDYSSRREAVPSDRRALMTFTELLLDRGDLEHAERAAQELASAAETAAQGLNLRARIALQRNDLDEAIGHARRALSTPRPPVEVYRTLGYALAVARRFAEASEVYDEAIRRHGATPELLLLAGETQLALGEPSKAEQLLRRIRDGAGLTSDLQRTHLRLVGTLRERQGRHRAALAAYRRGADRFPRALEFRYLEAGLLERIALYRQALRVYESLSAVEKEPAQRARVATAIARIRRKIEELDTSEPAPSGIPRR